MVKNKFEATVVRAIVEIYIIKIIKKSHPISTTKSFKTIILLAKDDISSFINDFRYIHIGLVQVESNP